LLSNIEKLIPPASVTSAILTTDFGISDYKAGEHNDDSIGKSVYTVILTDDRGKHWIASLAYERVLAQD
jgi:hypothetical protein